ncbi:LysR substrate-binding domain-containing protein [Lentilactobacillus sp. Marseille-Q4993]|uniref:LysR family transcriptional regulator n=1 Tax=Lentilactobacillus sp. Marseille-Q4993 TaxID=3039492 RepID=UPI0024BCD82C|nr:LysR substrate-binding domain-containing protein [Lentilactobacillus sp. Marseille-Q4993]
MIPFAYKVFSTVVEQGTFYKASVVLNVTPSAISHSINQLEQDLGFPVFNRSRTGVELTENGKQVLPIVQDILNTQKRLDQVANNINGLSSGSIKIGAFSSVCINWLPPIIQNYKKSYPDIDISVDQAGFADIVQEVKNGQIDIGFTSLPVKENLIVDALVKDEIYCITPKGFVPNNQQTVTKADMRGRKFILQRGDYDLDTKATLDHYSIQPNSLQFSIDDQSIIAMVEAGLGWGILPELALQKISGDVAVYPFDVPSYRSIGLVTSATLSKAPSTKKMITQIKEFVATNYPDRLLTEG